MISMSMFAAITWLAMVTNVRVTEHNENLIGLPPGQEQKTVIAQVSQAVFGLPARVFVHLDHDCADPGACRQHRLQRFPCLGIGVGA